MNATIPKSPPQRVLVSDFDGTMTRHDFYTLVVEKLLPVDTPDFWVEYRAGQISHFEALRRYFSAIRCGEDEVLAVVGQMRLDNRLATAVNALRAAGWHIVIASAGCEWYIRRLLQSAGVDLDVHANPGSFVEGQGLVMKLPVTSQFYSATLGIDKAAVVRHYSALGCCTAFAGDGFPDVEAARLVPAERRFARGDLARVLQQEGLEFHGLARWSEIPRVLIGEEE